MTPEGVPLSFDRIGRAEARPYIDPGSCITALLRYDHSEWLPRSSCVIFSRRSWWRPPAKGVFRKASTISRAAAGVTMRAPRARTLALLCSRASWAVTTLWAGRREYRGLCWRRWKFQRQSRRQRCRDQPFSKQLVRLRLCHSPGSPRTLPKTIPGRRRYSLRIPDIF